MMMYAEPRWLDTAFTVWKWWARLCGVIGLAALFSLAIILPQKNGQVWKVTNFELLTPVVERGGRIRYMMDVEALTSCPGNVVVTLSSMPGSGPPATVDYRSPVVHPGVNKRGLVRDVDITDAVGIGKWKGIVTINSRCPTHRQTDTAGEFEVEVR